MKTGDKSPGAAGGDSDMKKKSTCTYDDENTIPLQQHEEQILKTDFNVGLIKSEAENGQKSLAETDPPTYTRLRSGSSS